jgi:hypothetical protein
MNKQRKDTWRGLYLLGALALAMLLADALAPLSPMGHDLLTLGSILLATGSVLIWTEGHADLVETDGVDAWAADDQRQRGWFVSGGMKVALPRRSERSLPSSQQAALNQPEYGILDMKELQRLENLRRSEERVRTTT